MKKLINDLKNQIVLLRGCNKQINTISSSIALISDDDYNPEHLGSLHGDIDNANFNLEKAIKDLASATSLMEYLTIEEL